ncbi:hypothetical protein [Streptomyces stelliscabiei]|uniref:Uncharacterized protein n=1 Tax=Streptomyces stelliscabiei TaxID=146820 RepID=A0A8I0P6Q1_9ACTN|nr:hypothetical protein [Streptomyces stelliscabiei]MBE1597196.1 hypothetical protein [Streptomyces stelliscabiei]
MDMKDLEDVAHRYKKATDALDLVRTEMQGTAVALLQQDGVKQADVARVTGWSREHLRRLKEKAEMEALRRRVEELSTAKEPSPAAAAPRQRVTETLPDDPAPEPSEHVGVSPEVAALSYDEAQDLFRDAETRNIQWAFKMRRTLGTVPPGRRPYLGVQAGVDEGLITLPERPVSGEETNG